jgi:tetratricopeptide (TPR) repeat protein
MLEAAVARYRGNFLEGLELSSLHEFHSWCIAEREQALRAQIALLTELVRRLEASPEKALGYARTLVGLSPYDEDARAALVRLLVATRRSEEAEQQFQLGARMLKEAGIVPRGTLLQARRAPSVEPAAADADPVRATPAPITATLSAKAEFSLVGREQEIHRLTSAFSAVANESRSAVMLVHGEAGIGKSCLLDVVARLAQDTGAFLMEASAIESEVIRPFSMWIDALRKTGSDAADEVFGARNMENRDALFAALGSFVAGTAADRPVVALFDDAHWSDESSASALHYVARMNRQRPFLAIVAGREAELRENAPMQKAIRGLRRDGLLEEVKVGPLPMDAIVKLIRQRAPGVDGERLGEECGGNPLLAIELARAELEGTAGNSLEDLVRERLMRFGADGAEVLRWAAVLSPPIDISMLAQLTQMNVSEIAAVLERGEREAILSSGDRGLRFSHEMIARSVYADISPLRRQLMHRSIAELLERNTTVDLEYAADLAHHATQSGDTVLAVRALVSAGRLCLRFFSNDEALNLARRGMQLVDKLPDADRVRLSLELHDIILSAAPLDDWEAAVREYVSLAEEALDHDAAGHARLGYQMAAYVRWAHDQWNRAREETLQAERVIRSGSDTDQIIGMAETAKCLAMLERDLPQANAMLTEAQAIAARTRMSHQSIAAGLGMLRYHENRLDEAEELFKECRALCKSAGDRISEFQANEYLVMIDLERGRVEAACSRCDELLNIGVRLREGSEAPFARALRGLCLYVMEDEVKPLETALEELRAADAKSRLAYVLTRAALIDLERERLDEAIARGREALEYAQILERTTEMALAHAVLGLALRSSGDAARSTEHIASMRKLDPSLIAAWARKHIDKLAALD